MLFRTVSAAVYGVDADLVEVEVNLTALPSEVDKSAPVIVVGLPDLAVRESRERIRAAITNSSFFFPFHKTTINLAPADVRKEGASFDLPIALGILGANGDIGSGDALSGILSVGELALDGRVRSIRGALSIALCARQNGIKNLLLPEENAREAAVVNELNVYPINNLRDAVETSQDLSEGKPTRISPLKLSSKDFETDANEYRVDFSEVLGQRAAKRALEVASAGGHNILLVGPPGSGKSMLVKRLATILPPLEFEESLEITKIHSVAGLTDKKGLIKTRPFRNPHTTISDAGLIGGGAIPRPGEVSLAHRGVLFLDELPEFDRSVLEVLRQPIEDKKVTISRAAVSLTFPSEFMLTAAMNPCPCGFFNDSSRECSCTPLQIQRYVGKISGPLLDRIDIHIDVPAVKYQELRNKTNTVSESSADIRDRVLRARAVQLHRFNDGKTFSNAAMSPTDIRRFCSLDSVSEKLLESAMTRQGLSARAHDRILKVARTIADLENSADINAAHLSEAIGYRSLDRSYWS